MSDGKIATAAAKPQLSLIPDRALVGEARIRAYGAKKYGEGNYLKGTLADGAGRRYMDGVRRHFARLQAPGGLFTKESLGALDEESGLPEIDHMLCGLSMLREILIQEGVLPEDPGVGKEPPAKSSESMPTVKHLFAKPSQYEIIPWDAVAGAYKHRSISWFPSKIGAESYLERVMKDHCKFVPTERDFDCFWGVERL